MSLPDPGGSFTTGPSTVPVLNEPTPVAADNPNAPAPQANGTLASYVGAQAATQAQKESLLSSIAQLGSAGKAAFNQQQSQTQQTRTQALNSILASTGQAGQSAPAAQAITAANQASAGNLTGLNNSLQNYQNTVGAASSNWYNQIGAAIPIMEQRTSQQVNAYYAAQRLQAQQEASQRQVTALEAQKAQTDLQISQADLAAKQATLAGTNLTPAEQSDALKLQATKNGNDFLNLLNQKVQALNSYPAVQNGQVSENGQKQGDIFRSLYFSLYDQFQNEYKNQMTIWNNGGNKPGAAPNISNLINGLVAQAQASGDLVNVADPRVLTSWLLAGIQGDQQGWVNSQTPSMLGTMTAAGQPTPQQAPMSISQAQALARQDVGQISPNGGPVMPAYQAPNYGTIPGTNPPIPSTGNPGMDRQLAQQQGLSAPSLAVAAAQSGYTLPG